MTANLSRFFCVWVVPLLAMGGLLRVVYLLPIYLSPNWGRHQLLGLGVWLIGLTVLAIGLYIKFRRQSASGYLLAIFIFLLIGCGLREVLAASLFILSAFSLGRIICHWLLPGEQRNYLLLPSLVLGFTLWLLIFGGLIHWPINYRVVYVGLLVLPVIAIVTQPQWRTDWLAFRALAISLNSQVSRLPYLLLVLAGALVGYAAMHIFVPTVMWDDNAYHLSYWTQLRYHHKLLFDVEAQIWSVAPFAGDLFHSIISLMAGTDSKSSYNLILLIGLLGIFWQFTGRLLNNYGDRLLLLMLFFSTPMLCNLLLGLQTDLLLALLTTVGLYQASGEKLHWLDVLSVACISALCAATKLPAMLIGVSLLLVLFINLWRQRYSIVWPSRALWLKTLVVLIACAVVALQSYAIAYAITGNPVFPLYNGIFASSYAPANNMADLRYSPDVGWGAWQGFFFETGKYFEGLHFVAGFQYYLLFPLGVFCVLVSRQNWRYASLLVPIIGYAIPMFFAVHYWRYFFAILPVASLLIGYLLAITYGNKMLSGLVLRLSLAAVLMLNILFLPGISGYAGVGPGMFISSTNRAWVIERSAPEQIANDWLNQQSVDARVLIDYDRPYGATLAGKPYYNLSYSPQHRQEISAWKSKADVTASLNTWAIEYIYRDKWFVENTVSEANAALQEWIEAELVDEKLTVAFRVGDLTVYRRLTGTGKPE